MAMDQMGLFLQMWQLWWHFDGIWWTIITDWVLFSAITVVQLRHLSRDEDQSSTQPKLGA
jgi:Na+-driven multidrug efflux pump